MLISDYTFIYAIVSCRRADFVPIIGNASTLATRTLFVKTRQARVELFFLGQTVIVFAKIATRTVFRIHAGHIARIVLIRDFVNVLFDLIDKVLTYF